jgi:hypothetical protein
MAMATLVISSFGCPRKREAPLAPLEIASSPSAQTDSKERPPAAIQVPLVHRGSSRDGAPIALAKHGVRLVAYIADEDDTAIRAVDLESDEEYARTPLSGRPAQILVAKDGRLFVSLRDEQAVQAFAATSDVRAPLDPSAKAHTGVEPIGLAMTPDDGTLLVTDGGGHTVEGFAIGTLERTWAVEVAPEPRSVTVSNDGKTAFVSHVSSGHVSAIDVETRAVTVIDMGMPSFMHEVRRGHTCVVTIAYVPARVTRQGYALARVETDVPRSRRKSDLIFVPHGVVLPSGSKGAAMKSTAGTPTEVEAFDLGIIDAKARKRISPTHASSGQGAMCSLPRAAAADNTRHMVLVACLGNDRVIAYQTSSASAVAAVKWQLDVPSGPVGIVIDDEERRAVLWSLFARTVTLVPLEKTGTTKIEVSKIALSAPLPGGLPAEAALGRKLFHTANDARISRDGRACASCHPDGRNDGLVWSTAEGPRPSVTLVGRGVAPLGWVRRHESIRENLGTRRRTGPVLPGISEAEYEAIGRYLSTMKAPTRE